METMANEIMTNEVVAEATEDVVTVVSSNKNVAKTVAEIGLTAALTVGIAYLTNKYVIKPWKAKRATKKEFEAVKDDIANDCDVDENEAVDNVTDINEVR